jgi:hypothetical protein
MKDRPILFNGPMVRALLDGRKTQTRRAMKLQPIKDVSWAGGHYIPGSKRTEGSRISVEAPYVGLACPYGQPGDRLWVRETWMYGQEPKAIYRADTPVTPDGQAWRPSIHMPRAVSRITLEIVSVRVERLQDISEADAEAEGVGFLRHVPDVDETLTAKQLYDALWESINGNGSWNENPWVWVVEFKKVTP